MRVRIPVCLALVGASPVAAAPGEIAPGEAPYSKNAGFYNP